MSIKSLTSPVEDVSDYWAWYERAIASGWTDGLPLAPPTEQRVREILNACGREPDEVIGVIPPQNGIATMEQVAIQCAMAGCTPRLAPVVVAAVDAMLEPRFNLHGVQSTSNPCAPLVIVTGPIVRELGFNGGEGCFGGGSHANAAVGRAVRLILWNIGGGVAGVTDLATLGHPGKYTFAVAEDPATCPWEPFHHDAGFAVDASCVTVFACQPPEAIFAPGDADRILRVLATTLPTTGVNMFHAAGQCLVAIAQRPAQELARAGYTRADVRNWLYENARYEAGALRRAEVLRAGDAHMDYWGSAEGYSGSLQSLPNDARLPMVHTPDDIHVLVAGGPTQWWLGFLPGWGDYGGLAVTRKIDASGA